MKMVTELYNELDQYNNYGYCLRSVAKFSTAVTV